MKIGLMNNPSKNVYKEVEWIGKKGFDFVDLTIEPPEAGPDKIKTNRMKKVLRKYGLEVVGHTAWFLPLDSHYRSVRDATYRELKKALLIVRRLGGTTLNIHLPMRKLREPEKEANRYIYVLNKLKKDAKRHKIDIMLEHIYGSRDQFIFLDKVYKKIPSIKFHLDVGHANLRIKKNATQKFLKKYGSRLKHIHISDNKGKDDDHLALGKGKIRWKEIIKLLKKYKYDSTITIEIHSTKKDILDSKKKLRKWWDNA